MKCKICGRLKGSWHKMSCPVHKYGQEPVWVEDFRYDSGHNHTDEGWRTSYSISSDTPENDCS